MRSRATLLEKAPFAVWLTGLPGAGKSTLARFLKQKLIEEGFQVEVLESDSLRLELFPKSTYSPEERDLFYRLMVALGKRLVETGLVVIFDATANRRQWRERARQLIPRFAEVYVQCELKECLRRDPKGIYRKAQKGQVTTVPGLQSTYEEPENPELTLNTTKGEFEKVQSLLWAKVQQLFL